VGRVVREPRREGGAERHVGDDLRDAAAVDRQPDEARQARRGIAAHGPLLAEVDREPRRVAGDPAQRRGVVRDHRPLDHRRGCKVVGVGGGVVAEAAELTEPVLELVAQRRVRAGLLVAQGVGLQDPDRRDDRDRTDDQDADQELNRRAPRDRRLGLPLAATCRMPLVGGRWSGRRAHSVPYRRPKAHA
jgi:hypothetical protein